MHLSLQLLKPPQAWQSHRALLHRGLALSRVFNVSEALSESSSPPLVDSSERLFLKDFVNCTPGTLGSRLATWLQPTPFVDPNQCETVVAFAANAQPPNSGEGLEIGLQGLKS